MVQKKVSPAFQSVPLGISLIALASVKKPNIASYFTTLGATIKQIHFQIIEKIQKGVIPFPLVFSWVWKPSHHFLV